MPPRIIELNPPLELTDDLLSTFGNIDALPDHIHCFLELPATLCVADALQRLKGYSAFMIFQYHPWLRRYFRTGHLWSPGKFFRSVGSVSADAIQHYISQSNRGSRTQTLLSRYPGL